jgi:hypothetical protein
VRLQNTQTVLETIVPRRINGPWHRYGMPIT